MSKKTGKTFEQLACDYLKKHGLRLCAENFQCRYGEIDLIMYDRDTLCFIEVRFRQAQGLAAESVDEYKQRKIINTAECYRQQHNLFDDLACRFDVVAVDNQHDRPKITWLKSAFTAD